LQILTALKENTSAVHITFDEDNKYFSKGPIHHNFIIVGALIDLLNTNKNITGLALSNSNDQSRLRHIDPEVLKLLTSAIALSNLEDFHFHGWYMTDAVAENIAAIIRNTNNLYYVDISLDTEKEQDNDAALKITQAIGDSHNISAARLAKSDLQYPNQISKNDKIAKSLAQAMVDNPTIFF
jgi:hypothetical protein